MTGVQTCALPIYFVAECPFKSRIENGGRLIKKNNFIPKTKSFIKKVAPRELIANEGEYISRGEESEDDDEDKVGMASAAIGIAPSSLSSLFTDQNDKKSPTKHIFMAKGVLPKVTSSPKHAITSTPSLLDFVEKIEDNNANPSSSF